MALVENAKKQAPAVATEHGDTVAELYKTDQATWEYVTIPDEDALGNLHPPISLNAMHFEAGKTYKAPSKVAAFIRERLKTYQRATVRILSPKRDFDALNRVAMGSANSSNTQAVDPSTMGAGANDKVFTVA